MWEYTQLIANKIATTWCEYTEGKSWMSYCLLCLERNQFHGHIWIAGDRYVYICRWIELFQRLAWFPFLLFMITKKGPQLPFPNGSDYSFYMMHIGLELHIFIPLSEKGEVFFKNACLIITQWWINVIYMGSLLSKGGVPQLRWEGL